MNNDYNLWQSRLFEYTHKLSTTILTLALASIAFLATRLDKITTPIEMPITVGYVSGFVFLGLSVFCALFWLAARLNLFTNTLKHIIHLDRTNKDSTAKTDAEKDSIRTDRYLLIQVITFGLGVISLLVIFTSSGCSKLIDVNRQNKTLHSSTESRSSQVFTQLKPLNQKSRSLPLSAE